MRFQWSRLIHSVTLLFMHLYRLNVSSYPYTHSVSVSVALAFYANQPL